MISLDASVLIDLLRGDEEITERLSQMDERPAICFPVMCELYKGAYKARNSQKGLKEVEKLLEKLKILGSNPRSAKRFGELKQAYPGVKEFDLMIAAICLAHDTKLMTQDSDFDRISELEQV